MTGKQTSLGAVYKDDQKDVDVDDTYELPVDRGWAWCILASTFMSSLLAVGYYRSFGILFVEFLKTFKEPASVTSLIMGIQGATISISGYLTQTVLITRFDTRSIVTFGGFLMGSGIIVSFFANSIPALTVTQSIVVGAGIPMVVGSGIILLNSYFHKRRAMALAVSSVGANVGAIIFPPFVRYLLNEYGFGGTFLIMGSTVLHIMLFGMLLRPFSMYERKLKKNLAVSLLSDYQQQNTLNFEAIIPKRNGMVSDFRDRAYSDSYGMKRTSEYIVYCSSPDLVNACVSNVYQADREISSMNHMDELDQENDSEMATSEITNCQKCMTLFNVSLFKNPLFLIIIGTSMFGVHSITSMNTYIPALAKSKHVSKTNAAMMLSIVAATGIIGRLLVGFMSDSNLMKRPHIMSVSLAITGICALCSPLYEGFQEMIVFSVLYGFFGGLYFVLMSALMVDFLGLERLSACYGFMQLFNGASMALIIPLAGWVKDETGTFDISYQMFGCFALIAAAILLLEPLARTSKCTSIKNEDDL